MMFAYLEEHNDKSTLTLDRPVDKEGANVVSLARLDVIAECDHIAINKWLVQAVYKGVWFTAYFALPPKRTPRPLYKTREDALMAVLAMVKEAIGKE